MTVLTEINKYKYILYKQLKWTNEVKCMHYTGFK